MFCVQTMENTRGHTRENTEHKIIREEVLIFRLKTSYAKEVLLLYEKRHWAVLIVHVLKIVKKRNSDGVWNRTKLPTVLYSGASTRLCFILYFNDLFLYFIIFANIKNCKKVYFEILCKYTSMRGYSSLTCCLGGNTKVKAGDRLKVQFSYFLFVYI